MSENPLTTSIFRVVHNKENPYVLLNKGIAQDKKLTCRAIGLMTKCLSYPDDWTFHVKKLIEDCQEGRDTIYKIIDELIRNGYVIKHIKPNRKNGKIHGSQCIYYFFEFKLSEEERVIEAERIKKSFRHPEVQYAGSTDTVDKDIPSTEVIPSTKAATKDLGHKMPENVHNSEPSKAKTLEKTSASHKFDSETLDVQRRWKMTDEQMATFDWLKSKNIDAADEKLTYWAKHYTLRRLIDVYNESVHNGAKSLRKYMGKLLDGNKVVHNSRIESNAEFARDYAKSNSWSALEVHKKYVTFPMGRDTQELSLDMEPIEFAMQLMAKHESSERQIE